MKKVLGFILLIIIFSLTFKYKNDITKYIVNNYIYKKNITIPDSNKYKRSYDFLFVHETNNFIPNNKQELYNVFYTVLNNGYNTFTFYCGEEYKECMDDVTRITNDGDLVLTSIDNYVHPFNSYNSIDVNMNNLGRITLTVNKLYSDDEIKVLSNKVDQVYSSIIKDNMTVEEKIKTIHNYIINNTIYDKEWINLKEEDRKYKSNKAYGPLIEGYGLCGGYTDAMELFLEKMGVKSYKISNNDHIWNYVYINGNWKHLDLTWDDPVTNNGKNLLQFDYFLIDTNKLLELDQTQHLYNNNMYLEAK